mgnify:CR=1 FL=1
MSLMVSISGIRGIVGTSLTPEVAVRYAAAHRDEIDEIAAREHATADRAEEIWRATQEFLDS